MTTRREDLAAYLAAAARTPFAYGEHDCALFVAGWVRRCTGVDAGAEWRGHYGSERGWRRLAASVGGLEAVFAAGAARAGAYPVTELEPGDFGLVSVRDGARRVELAGAICAGRRWVSLRSGALGLIAGTVPAAAAWRP